MKIILLGISLLSISLSQAMTEQEMNQLLKVVQPPAKESWRSIPWQPSLAQGQNEAIDKKQPLFIWAMDGHPLGCV